jgi:signal transduction histidine kinase
MGFIRIKKEFFTSRVARRIFFLFIVCAMLPLTILAGITFFFASNQLTDQATRRLQQACKSKGFEIYEHLLLLESELQVAAVYFQDGQPDKIDFTSFSPDKDSRARFLNLVFVGADDQKIKLLNDISDIPSISGDKARHLGMGRTLVYSRLNADRTVRLFMARMVDPTDSDAGMLLAEINPVYLWGLGSEAMLAPDTEMFVYDQQHRHLASSMPGLNPAKTYVFAKQRNRSSGSFKGVLRDKKFVFSYWSLFIKHRFFVRDWIILIGQPEEEILAPLANFKKAFWLLMILTFWVVLLLSVVLIRKNLVPIEILTKGTIKIAEGDIGALVDIKSGDEFEALGNAFNDMSHKLKESTALLQQSAKMGAFGQMASGVVHEIGQPLTSISGILELAKIDESLTSFKDHLPTLTREMDRLSQIVSKFRSFSRASDMATTRVSINQVLEETLALLKHQLNVKGIQCRFDKTEHLPPVLGESHGMQQVFLNLILNAADALEGAKGVQPAITIRTRGVDHRVMVNIEDNGGGISEDIQKRMFDPFFTTKGPEEGTGLGLAITASILHRHKALIDVSSREGEGTVFTISFPAATSPE